MTKEKFIINSEYLRILGIDPEEGIEYLESKKTVTIDPIHVIALQILKQSRPMVASSQPDAI